MAGAYPDIFIVKLSIEFTEVDRDTGMLRRHRDYIDAVRVNRSAVRIVR